MQIRKIAPINIKLTIKMRLNFHKGVALFAVIAIQCEAILPYKYDNEQMLVQASSEAESQAEAQAEFFNKIARFARTAYKRMKPVMGNLRKFTGPHADAMLGNTPVG